jgi:hypothetical protein
MHWQRDFRSRVRRWNDRQMSNATWSITGPMLFYLYFRPAALAYAMLTEQVGGAGSPLRRCACHHTVEEP